MSLNFMVDMKISGTSFPHYWEMCIGSCHAYMGLREDWRKQLKKCHDELGFQYVRFHGLFDDVMSVYIKDSSSGEIRYSFFNIDSVFDYLMKIGMKPFIELGFMPEVMASGNTTCFHYKGNVTPPADYNEWGKLVRLFTEHMVNRYGLDEVRTWFFEVWNEPNLKFFWDGTKEEYFKLYKHSADAIKSVDRQLRVGGPATSINAWIPDIIEFCKLSDTPIDFISTHHYPTDDPLWKNNELSLEGFFKRFANDFGNYERGILYKMTSKAKLEAGNLPLYYTEWNTSAVLPDAIHDESYSAALVAKTIVDNDGLVQAYSFWTFSDLFEEQGQYSLPFHGGFGLQTIHGIPKPTYRLFELMRNMGHKRLKVIGDEGSTVEMLATVDEEKISLLVYNHEIMNAPIKEETIRISLNGFISSKPAYIARIDTEYANPKRKWIELGSPEYPSHKEIEEITKASQLFYDNIQIEQNSQDSLLQFTIPPHAVVQINIGL